MHDGSIAQESNARGPADDPVGYVATGDRSDSACAEGRANLDVADDVLDNLRRQHSDKGSLDVVDRPVDHAVGADVDALALGEAIGLGPRPDVEPDDDGRRC